MSPTKLAKQQEVDIIRSVKKVEGYAKVSDNIIKLAADGDTPYFYAVYELCLSTLELNIPDLHSKDPSKIVNITLTSCTARYFPPSLSFTLTI
jgi:hypothetical protein